MARYSTGSVSQTAQLAGAPSGTTVNGYIGYWGASATAGFRLKRMMVGMRLSGAGTITSQQITVAVHRQTVAPAGTGLAAAILGEAQEIWTPTDPTVGLITTTATTIGTTGPTINANPLFTPTWNDQSGWDLPFEFPEDVVVNKGTANGIAFVLLGQTLPSLHLVTLTVEVEV